MASAAFKPSLRFTSWCPVYARSCWAVHLGPAVPREVLHMNTQHWQLYVTQTDSTARSYDKTGQLCISPTFLWPTPWTQINPRAPLNHLPLRTPYLPTCALHQDPSHTETVFLSLPLFTCCALGLHSEIIILLSAGLILLCQILLSGSAGLRSATRLQLFGT